MAAARLQLVIIIIIIIIISSSVIMTRVCSDCVSQVRGPAPTPQRKHQEHSALPNTRARKRVILVVSFIRKSRRFQQTKDPIALARSTVLLGMAYGLIRRPKATGLYKALSFYGI